MLSRRQKMALDAMEIPVWKIRPEPDAPVAAVPEMEAEQPPLSEYVPEHIPEHLSEASQSSPQNESVPARPEVDNLPGLQNQVAACQACELATSRSQTVFGNGDAHARLMIIGEAPGAEEDRQGLPFVGAAGQLLSEMLHAIGLQREQVYIANMLKCRPPDNRDPKKAEIQTCEHFLRRQIELIQPKLILVLGRIAAQNLLQRTDNLARLRGKSYCYAETSVPLMVSYHPAYLLRTPKDKAKAWQDLIKVKTFLGEI
ncbi:MAG TPA: uracil-DNA glycosylase [Gammaproteobacteria bacterium]|nr:uracil-DNA glycosylase [Gammaproteobacteria bacterium]